jgi:hypothetical protein
MIIITITIFIIAIVTAIGLLSFSAWEVESGVRNPDTYPVFKISIRKIEKYVLYYTKWILQSIVINIVKVWFILVAKTKKFLKEKWPKLVNKLHPKPLEVGERPSFVRRAVIESKIKIKRAKENIREKHKVEVKTEEEENMPL